LALIAVLLVPLSGGAAGSRPDDHAPIGVMGDHTHAAGELMLSYRFSHMSMSGNRSRSEHQSTSDVLGRGFAATPTDMDMQMHGFGLMYAPTDWVTLMAMIPVVDKGMDHVNVMRRKFTTRSDGLGDVKLAGLWPLWERDGHKVHLGTGISFPTGSIDRKDTIPTPGGPMRVRLPYPMQIGSGSYALLPGLTYLGRSEQLSWGGQAQGTLFLDENRHDYRLGDRADLTLWLARPWASWVSTSVRLGWSYAGNIRGADPRLNPNQVPTADPDRRGGTRSAPAYLVLDPVAQLPAALAGIEERGIEGERVSQVPAVGLAVQRLELAAVGVGLGFVRESALGDQLVPAQAQQRCHLGEVVLRMILDRPEAPATVGDGDGLDAAERIRRQHAGTGWERAHLVRVAGEGVEARRLVAIEGVSEPLRTEGDVARDAELAALRIRGALAAGGDHRDLGRPAASEAGHAGSEGGARELDLAPYPLVTLAVDGEARAGPDETVVVRESRRAGEHGLRVGRVGDVDPRSVHAVAQQSRVERARRRPSGRAQRFPAFARVGIEHEQAHAAVRLADRRRS
jgi:hypothetical protein